MKQRKKSASEKRTTYSVVVCVVRTAQNSDEESMVVSNDGPRSRLVGSAPLFNVKFVSDIKRAPPDDDTFLVDFSVWCTRI